MAGVGFLVIPWVQHAALKLAPLSNTLSAQVLKYSHITVREFVCFIISALFHHKRIFSRTATNQTIFE